ncbi:MAG: hypothetical protein WED05_10255 [Candidatus Atabeyarchaeum deiterrae]
MIDWQSIVSLEIIAVKEQAKVYGPVIPRLVAASSVKFVAEKLNEEAPTVDTLEQAVNYIKKNQSRYPKAFTALGYGVIKAVSTLEGKSGAGTRLFKSIMKTVMESMGLKKVLGSVAGTADAARKNTKFNEDMNVIQKGITEISGDYNNAFEQIRGCDYTDVCTKLLQERITRAAVGGSECTYALSDAAAAAILTGVEHEYELTSFKPPICEYRVFQLEG